MALKTFYKVYFTNAEGEDITIDFIDRTYDAITDTFTEVEIQAYAPALILETYNTSENPFTPIMGTRAIFNLRSTNEVNFATFADGEDNKWFVRASYDSATKFIFTGFVDMDDNQRPFLPNGQSFQLSATDGFGLLKNIPLADFNNETPSFTANEKLITIIQWCLHKTGLRDLMDRIHVIHNLYEENHEDRSVAVSRCALNQTYVKLIDFCKKPNEFEDCYTVLERILFSLGCRIFTYNNNWYIVRLDEYRNGLQFDYTSYFTGGNPASGTTGAGLGKQIDSSVVDLVKAETIERIQRPSKQALIKKKYEFPEELIRNSDFIRGDVIDDVLPLKTFNLDDWTKVRINVTTMAEDTTTSHDVYIQRRYNTREYEIERVLVVTPRTFDATYREGVNCTPFPVCEGDKFSFSFQWRFETDAAGAGDLDVILADIYVDDGVNKYYLGNTLPDGEGQWLWSDASLGVPRSTCVTKFVPDDLTETEWQHFSFNYDDIPPIPFSGNLTVRLMSMNQLVTAIDNVLINYQRLEFDYVPLINGTYQKFDYEQFRMYTDDNYSKKYEEFFHLYDAPCKSFKSAMMYLDTGEYFLTSNWFDRAAENYLPGSIPTSMQSGELFLRWQMFSVWNQIRMARRVFNFSLWGFDSANAITKHAGPLHQYTLGNVNLPLSDMYFIMLSMRQNWHDCTWTATMVEVNQSTYPRQENNFEFKYIE